MRRRTALRRSGLRARFVVERLEIREVLSTAPAVAGWTASPLFEATPYTNPTPPGSALTPSQVRTAYGFSSVSFNGVAGDGSGQTIAIVDAYDDPNIQADLNTFSTQFGLPTATVTRVSQIGTTAYPATDSSGGWEMEESLDVEWAHAIAPGAKILLVEAASPSDTDLMAAVDYAAAHADVISLSWGGGEWSGETAYDSHFSKPGVAFVASSGDNGAPISWPSSSPNVLAVGGTSLTLGSGSTYASESGWSGSGGGPSAYEARPSYQTGVVTQTTARANPDVAYDADPNTGFAVYESYGSNPGWMQVGGTSAGAPQWAALIAIADQGRAANGLPKLDASSPTEVMTTLYKNATSGDFHDVTTGSSSGSPVYTAAAGFDYVTGIGSPKANLVIPALVGVASSTTADHLVVSAPTSTVAGSSFTITVTARNASNAVDSAYAGTVHFASTDGLAGLPANYTFTSADGGTHTFTVTLKTAATQSITVTDTTTGATSATASGIVVSPAAASRLAISGLPSAETVGAAHTVTITAYDPYGNVATGYLGTVHFSSTDAAATLPASYAFTAADKGAHTFTVTFNTAGTQSLTATDAAGLTVTQSSITVSPAAPVSLTASAAGSTQINLSWTGAAGATGYAIERSANGSTGWAQVGTVGLGVTTYSDTGLAAGTTYYYRVKATGGGVSSAYSNTANATTTGAVAASQGLWAASTVPNEDGYSYGSFELGVRFYSDVAGTVTGVRFYKQSWMSNWSHVGHIWSPTGQLLGTAAFTNETASGWQQVTFATPVTIQPNAMYIVSFSTGGGLFGLSNHYFTYAGVDNGPLHAPSNSAGGNGVYSTPGQYPTTGGSGMNFWVDPIFTPSSTGMTRVAGSTTTAAGSAILDGTAPATAVAPGGAGTGETTVTIPAFYGRNSRAVVASAATRTNPPQADGSSSWTYRRSVPQASAFSARGWSQGE